MELTDEQLGAVRSNGRTVLVNALAGTGKTSMLVAYAQARPKTRMLYLAFNKAIADEARERFPGNVDCKTTHALAYGGVGHTYRHKLIGRSIKPNEVCDLLRLPANDEQMRLNGAALNTLNRYLSAADFDIGEELIGRRDLEIVWDGAAILRRTEKIWNAMCDANSAFPMVHDGYLKLYQMQEPNLSRRYDVLLLDEAQDLNEVTLSIAQEQDCGRVLVGDTHQSIYGFRHTIDALRMGWPGGDRHYLTGSFRFGEPVADAANLVLRTFKNETRRLRGLGQGGHIGMADAARHYAVIQRTNAGLFDAAVEAHQNGRSLHFVGGVENYRFQDLVDVLHLRHRRHGSIRDPYLRSFDSFNAMEEYAESMEDHELKSRAGTVKRWGNQIPDLVRQLQAAHVPEDQARCSLMTAHKSKGLEYPQVVLGDDFPDLLDKKTLKPRTPYAGNEKGTPLPDEEANLAYVAVTRARSCLDLGQSSLKTFAAQVDPELLRRARAPERMPPLPDLEPAAKARTPTLGGGSR